MAGTNPSHSGHQRLAITATKAVLRADVRLDPLMCTTQYPVSSFVSILPCVTCRVTACDVVVLGSPRVVWLIFFYCSDITVNPRVFWCSDSPFPFCILVFLQDEMGEARAVMRALKEERDEIRSHLDTMQVRSAGVWPRTAVLPPVILPCSCNRSSAVR